MNELTALFMEVLGLKTDREARAAEIVRSSMKRELAARMEELAASGTLYLSESGRNVQRDLRRLEERIDGLRRASDAAPVCKDLKMLFIHAEELHRETQTELHKKGRVRIERLHFFYPEEQAEALLIAEELIHTELYRILALGGGRMFTACKPLNSYRHTLKDRMKYLREEILPITASEEFKQLARPRCWAVTRREQLRAGALGELPGYEILEPLKTERCFRPGEHKVLSTRSASLMQGMGFLTNVEPGSVEQAQLQGELRTKLRAEQLHGCLGYLEDPDRVLNEVFAGAYYAISPEVYYSAASFAEASSAVVRRRGLGLCLLCGQSAEREAFCPRCRKRFRIT